MMKKLCISILMLMMGQTFAWAHNPSEVSYFFKMDQNELIIHLTPKTAVDILRKIHPEMRDAKVVNLSEYLSDFETYFTNGVAFLVDERPIMLKLMNADLTHHEATLIFTLEQLPKKTNLYHISVKSLIDVYPKGKNYLFVTENGKKHHYILDRQQTQISGNFGTSNPGISIKLMGISIIYTVLALLSIGYVVHRKIKIQLNHLQKTGS